jgi:hypothetical protein
MANVTLVTPNDGTAILTFKASTGSSRAAFPDKYPSYTRPNKNIPIPNRPQTPSGSP